jgi:hypothetical protein
MLINGNPKEEPLPLATINSHSCHIPLRIKHHRTTALCDTGAAVDAVNTQLIQANPAIVLARRVYQGGPLVTADQSKLQPKTEVLLPITLAGTTCKYWFILLDNHLTEIIFGTTFMKQFELNIDFHAKQITLHNFKPGIPMTFPLRQDTNNTICALIPIDEGVADLILAKEVTLQS